MRFLTATLLLCFALDASAAEATRAVLVTGASTGIGRKITEHLVAKGYFVYA
jgi:NADP-dependent 3-hydroxy acid dehydrogenase YdfG